MKWGCWLLVTKEFKGFSMYIYVRDWVSSIILNPPLVKKVFLPWKTPLNGSLKLNSMVVISWGLGNCVGSWSLVHLIHEIRELFLSLGTFYLTFLGNKMTWLKS